MKTAKIALFFILALGIFINQPADSQRVVIKVNPRLHRRERPVVYVAPRPVYIAPRPVYVAPRPVIMNSWQILGTTVVNFATDRDVIRVAGADRFRQLRFTVQDAAIEILDMDVVYENGGHDDIPVRQVIENGSDSRAIDLRGRSRRIREVSFVYRSMPGFTGQRAKLTLFGIR